MIFVMSTSLLTLMLCMILNFNKVGKQLMLGWLGLSFLCVRSFIEFEDSNDSCNLYINFLDMCMILFCNWYQYIYIYYDVFLQITMSQQSARNMGSLLRRTAYLKVQHQHQKLHHHQHRKLPGQSLPRYLIALRSSFHHLVFALTIKGRCMSRINTVL